MTTKLAIFASGNGSNAEEIIRYFKKHSGIEVGLILCNNPKAYVLQRALNHQIPHFVFDRNILYKEKHVDEILRLHGISFLVLAGFMWLLPERFMRMYPGRILNIHPALLPKYGGKGMYSMHVHEAVVRNKEKESGITIHLVNEEYDQGAIVFQATCDILPGDTPEDVASKVHKLEYQHYPEVIEKTILSARK